MFVFFFLCLFFFFWLLMIRPSRLCRMEGARRGDAKPHDDIRVEDRPSPVPVVEGSVPPAEGGTGVVDEHVDSGGLGQHVLTPASTGRVVADV